MRIENGEDAIRYLNMHSQSQWKLGLERTSELLNRVGNPQKDLHFVHVAGTNGKGSTCAMTARILEEAGYRTGLYPSPYIEEFCERIQCNGKNISLPDLARFTRIVAAEAEKMEDRPTHFELITAIGMLYFKEVQCDIVVLEVGLGGRFDSTNVIDAPEAAVICNIGLDHTDILGDTVEKIAFEKGGIIKPGSEVVLYDMVPEAYRVIEELCRKNGNRIWKAAEMHAKSLKKDLYGQIFSAGNPEKIYRLNLLGPHQLKNAETVLTLVEALRARGYQIPEEAVTRGLDTVRWPVRFEVLSHSPLFILDGGHNPQCAQALSDSLNEYLPGEKVTFLIGMLGDKDYRDVIKIIGPHAAEFYCITPDSTRALPSEKLTECLRTEGFQAASCDGGISDTAAIETAILEALGTGRPVVAFGSLYSAGSIRKLFPEALKKFRARLDN